MKMGIAIIALTIIYSAFARNDEPLNMALKSGADVQIKLQVVDQNGEPVPDAKVLVGFQTGWGKGDFDRESGKTDKNGLFVISGKCTDRLRCSVVKEGFYHSHFVEVFSCSKTQPPVLDGRWQPYGMSRKVTLNQILAPEHLVSHQYEIVQIPKQGEWMGFDLERCDWIAPWGKGVCDDVLLRLKSDARNTTSEFSSVLEVSFTNQVKGAFYVAKKSDCSDLKTAHMVDTNLFSSVEKVFSIEKRPGLPTIDTRLGDDEYLVFRTRTKVNDKGELVSAHYGVILGPWRFLTSMRASAIYFNTSANDLNLEDEDTARLSRKRIGEVLAGFSNL